jgi:hypothetical protein
MILENDGLNNAQLLAAGFPEFIMTFAKAHLPGDDTTYSPEYEISALTTWLLCFTLSHRRRFRSLRHRLLLTSYRGRRSGLCHNSGGNPRVTLSFCHPRHGKYSIFKTSHTNELLLDQNSSAGINISRQSSESDESSHGIADNVISDPELDIRQVVYISQRPSPECPDPSSAAIILTFALNEAVSLAIPPHLPENRAVALVTHRSGPTMEDFRAVASCKTPLFADIRRGRKTKQASTIGVMHPDQRVNDVEFCKALRLSYDLVRSSARHYVPGTLTGTWDGSYMVS